MAKSNEIEVIIPEGAIKQEEEALIQAAVDKRIDGDVDDVLGDFFK